MLEEQELMMDSNKFIAVWFNWHLLWVSTITSLWLWWSIIIFSSLSIVVDVPVIEEDDDDEDDDERKGHSKGNKPVIRMLSNWHLWEEISCNARSRSLLVSLHFSYYSGHFYYCCCVYYCNHYYLKKKKIILWLLVGKSQSIHPGWLLYIYQIPSYFVFRISYFVFRISYFVFLIYLPQKFHSVYSVALQGRIQWLSSIKSKME